MKPTAPVTALCPKCHEESAMFAKSGECYGCGYRVDNRTDMAIVFIYGLFLGGIVCALIMAVLGS